MAVLAPLPRRLRSLALPLGAGLLVAYFAYHSIQGEHGLLARKRLEAQVAEAEAVLAALTAERERHEHRAGLLNPGHLDADMLDEQIRRMLNFARPGELILSLPDDSGAR